MIRLASRVDRLERVACATSPAEHMGDVELARQVAFLERGRRAAPGSHERRIAEHTAAVIRRARP